MNSKAQFEFHPFSIVGGLLGGFFGVFLADRMFAGLMMKLIVFVVVGVACLFVTNLILNKD